MALTAYPMRGGLPRPPAPRRTGGRRPVGAAAGHLRLVAGGGELAAGGDERGQGHHPGHRPGAPLGTRPVVAEGTRRHPGLRRLAPGVAVAGGLLGLWLGASALAGAAGAGRLVRLPGTRPVPGGYAYVVRPGDTLWSIASRLEPGNDPRALVDQLASQAPGGRLLAGSVLVVP